MMYLNILLYVEYRIICIAIYIITSVFIILYGLKFGKVKSLHWITTIVIGILQSTLVVEPLLIAISSLVWWFNFDQVTLSITVVVLILI